MCIGICVKYSLFLNFLGRFWINIEILNLMKMCPGGGGAVVPYGRTDVWTDRQTHMTKLIVAFRNFAKAPNKQCKFTGA